MKPEFVETLQEDGRMMIVNLNLITHLIEVRSPGLNTPHFVQTFFMGDGFFDLEPQIIELVKAKKSLHIVETVSPEGRQVLMNVDLVIILEATTPQSTQVRFASGGTV